MNLRTNGSVKVVALMALLVVLFCPGSLMAQEARGKITGKVLDAGKAVVPGAKVKVTNVEMGTSTNSPANDAGLFVASFLTPGT